MTDNQYIFLNSIAYIANRFNNRTVDFHKLSKVFYFAEQKHLVKYGSKLIDDEFIAMDNGPVPSAIYDLLKGLKNSPNIYPVELKNAFKFNGRYTLTSLVEPEMEWLSESEIICIEESITEVGNLSFKELSDKSHDSAWQADYYMKSEKIALAGGANEAMISYIKKIEEQTTY
jgi:uncharacterized phage-associated protein